MITELTDEDLKRRVRWATTVTDERHLEWNPGLEPTLGDLLGLFRGDHIEEPLDEGCWLVKLGDEEDVRAPLTVARLGTNRDDWYSLGPWGPASSQEARRCGFVKQAGDVPPVPLWKVGEIVYRSSVDLVEDRVACPDCLGTGSWVARSGAGETFPLRCPRCDGRKHLSNRIPGAVGAMFHVRSIEARTGRGHRGSAVTYYDSTGCCGTTAAEWELFSTEADAVAFAELRARRARVAQEQREQTKAAEDLRMRTVVNAAIREAERKQREAECNYDYLVERVMDLRKEESSLYVSGKIVDEGAYEGGTFGPSLSASDREAIVAWIMSMNSADEERYCQVIHDEKQEGCNC